MLEKGDGIMSTYVGAVEDFRKSATAFMQHVDLLSQARDAYQQAMTASAELRTVLDAGDENLRTLMAQLEQALGLHMAKPVIDRFNCIGAGQPLIDGTTESQIPCRKKRKRVARRQRRSHPRCPLRG